MSKWKLGVSVAILAAVAVFLPSTLQAKALRDAKTGCCNASCENGKCSACSDPEYGQLCFCDPFTGDPICWAHE